MPARGPRAAAPVLVAVLVMVVWGATPIMTRLALEDLEPDLAPYRLLIANGIAGVMVAHVVFPEIDSLPASVSRCWVRSRWSPLGT